MKTIDGIWIPSYYRRRHPFLWARAAGGPQVVDWIAGAVFAALVFGLVALAFSHAPRPEAAPSAAATTEPAAKDSDVDADRVAYVPRRPSTVDK